MLAYLNYAKKSRFLLQDKMYTAIENASPKRQYKEHFGTAIIFRRTYAYL